MAVEVGRTLGTIIDLSIDSVAIIMVLSWVDFSSIEASYTFSSSDFLLKGVN